MSDATHIVLIIFYIFFFSVGLIFFFNITYRYRGKLNSIDNVIIFVVLVAVMLFVINLVNYTQGYADTRNAERSQDVQILADAVFIYMQDYRAKIYDLGAVPTCPVTKDIGTAKGNIDISSRLSDTLASVPVDPGSGTAEDTGYTICITDSHRIMISAPHAEKGKLIVTKK